MKWLRKIRAILSLKKYEYQCMRPISAMHVYGKDGTYDHSTIYLCGFVDGDNFVAIDYDKNKVWKRGEKVSRWQVAELVTGEWAGKNVNEKGGE